MTAVVLVALAAYAGSVPVADAEPGRASTAAGPAGVGWSPNVADARRYAKRRAGDVRFAIRFRGIRGAHRAGRPTASRSVVKVMMLAAYLRSRDVRDRRLTAGQKKLLGAMIRFSNNRAANEMTTRVSSGQLYRVARAAGMRDFRYELPYWGNSVTTAADQARFMHRFDRLIPDRHVGYARQLLHSITERQRWGVAQAKPTGWKLHFKSGWGSGGGETENQVAFLTRAGCRVSLAIFAVANPSARYARVTQRGVARRLLEGLSRKTC